MTRPQNEKNKVHPDGCLLPPSEHELLFSRRALIETVTRPLMVVEVARALMPPHKNRTLFLD